MAQGPLPGKAAAEEHAVGTLTETSVEMGRYIGSRMLRKEDDLLVTGHGHFLDDLVLPGMVWMAVVRSGRRLQRRRPGLGLGRRAALRLADRPRDQDPDPLAGRPGQGPHGR
jgi:hypothetical protein